METREQQYLRILESGPRGPEDYEAVKYLASKGYTNSILDSSSRPDDTYGKVTSVFWTGPTANGLDYIAYLTAGANESKELGNKKPNGSSNAASKEKQWYEKPLGLIWIGLAASILSLLVAYWIRMHLGIPV